jgi:hypothetical protein
MQPSMTIAEKLNDMSPSRESSPIPEPKRIEKKVTRKKGRPGKGQIYVVSNTHDISNSDSLETPLSHS